MNRHWYPFFVGDYARKTTHLSLLEHGAYRLLIDHYMATSHPLPKDFTKLYRICRATSPAERKSVHQIIEEFFTSDGEFLHNEKCDSEIAKQLNLSKSQSAKAQIRHGSRHKSGNDSAHAQDMPTTTTTTVRDKKYIKRTVQLDEWEATNGILTIESHPAFHKKHGQMAQEYLEEFRNSCFASARKYVDFAKAAMTWKFNNGGRNVTTKSQRAEQALFGKPANRAGEPQASFTDLLPDAKRIR